MSKWFEVYSTRLNDSYYKHVVDRYSPLIDAIKEERRPGDFIVEVGCGMANITRALVGNNIHSDERYLAIDNCSKMLLLARSNLHPRQVILKECDVTSKKDMEIYKADIVHSHGLLEHFGDKAINQIIENGWAMGARAQFHYVPGHLYEVPSFGDERLMKPEKWRNITFCDSVTIFNDGYDYVLCFRRKDADSPR